MFYRVSAHYFLTGSQPVWLPAFYLNSNIQGITDTGHAHKIANDIMSDIFRLKSPDWHRQLGYGIAIETCSELDTSNVDVYFGVVHTINYRNHDGSTTTTQGPSVYICAEDEKDAVQRLTEIFHASKDRNITVNITAVKAEV